MTTITRPETQLEKARIGSLLELIPKGRSTVLDVGAQDGYISQYLVNYFDTVTALDLEKPRIDVEHVIPVKGDATCLEFPADSFDTVFCVEVLEHIPSHLLPKACAELARVARYDLIIGVPYRQNLRDQRLTCAHCGRINPAWGHVNRFDEEKIRRLFAPLDARITLVIEGGIKDATSSLSVWLMDRAGNPWGTYDQPWSCLYCGKRMPPPAQRTLVQKMCSKAAYWLNAAQRAFERPKGYWMHVVIQKRPFPLAMAQGEKHTNQPGSI